LNNKKRTAADIQADIDREYENWKYLHDHGGQDPFWSDGVNMNLIRNHIIYYRKELAELENKEGIQCCLFDFEEIGEDQRPLPPEMPNDYMANAEEIRIGARKIYDQLYKNPIIAFLSTIRVEDKRLSRQIGRLYTNAWLSELKNQTEADSLVDMRRLYNRGIPNLAWAAACAITVLSGEGRLASNICDQPLNLENPQEKLLWDIQNAKTCAELQAIAAEYIGDRHSAELPGEEEDEEDGWNDEDDGEEDDDWDDEDDDD
jgi:hypothetical protein